MTHAAIGAAVADAPSPPRPVALGRIMRHEWRALAADRTLWVVAALFTLLLAYGLVNGARWARFRAGTVAAATAEYERRLAGALHALDTIPADAAPPGSFGSDPRSPGQVGGSVGVQYAVLPPAPLAALAVGQSDLFPPYFKVTSRSRSTFVVPDEIENPANLLEGRFDLAFVVVYLYPLLILALTYNLLSAEREQGTLALLLSQPVRLGRVLAGKIAVRAALLAGLAIGLTAVGLLLAGADLRQPGALAGLGLWAAIVLAYGAFWFAVAVAVNLLGRSSATNAVALAGTWLVLVLVVPSLLSVTVAAAHPVPSRVEMIGAMREASNAANARGSQILARYYEDHPELAPPGDSVNLNDFLTRTYTVQMEVDSAVAPVLARYDGQLRRQRALVQQYRYLSPAVVAHEALSDIAGSGLARYEHFQRLVAEFHGAWRGFFVPRIFRKSLLTRADYGTMPSYRFVEEPTPRVAGRVGLALVGLLAPTLLVVVFGAARGRRFQVAA